MSSSIGMMTFPTEWENTSHVAEKTPTRTKRGLLTTRFFRAIVDAHLRNGADAATQLAARLRQWIFGGLGQRPLP